MQTQSTTVPAKWAELLRSAVEEPGTISAAYSAFHNYSTGNQMLAFFQCKARDIQPGPISTYPGWLKNRRYVRKGEKALILCMPITFRKKDKKDDEAPEVVTTFVYKPHWFVLSQTAGDEYTPVPTPEWDKARALTALDIREIAFDHADGNSMGYARRREVAVSPLAFDPHKTLFHELAHVILGHTTQGERTDSERTPRDLCEVEAESVALIVCESLGLGDGAHARGYIQSWMRSGGRDAIPEKSAQRIFNAADKILKAGRNAQPVQEG